MLNNIRQILSNFSYNCNNTFTSDVSTHDKLSKEKNIDKNHLSLAKSRDISVALNIEGILKREIM